MYYNIVTKEHSYLNVPKGEALNLIAAFHNAGIEYTIKPV